MKDVRASFPPKKPPQVEEFEFGAWKIRTCKSHIMCSEEEEVISSKLSLPHLPDMLFLNNSVSISRAGSQELSLSFSPLEALKGVNNHEELVQVSSAAAWQASRKDCPHLNKVVQPYDWTFTTPYSGSLSGPWTVKPTQESINYEKLKIQEKILFFDEVLLFEDELDDNGCTKLSVKLRVMPSGFFILLRFYLRVDNTLVRVYDTRIYHEVDKPYLLKEYSEREASVDKLSVSRDILTDQNRIVDHLPIVKTITEVLRF